MARCLFSAILLLLLGPQLALAQADGCRGALEALNRVKEQITPRLSASTKQGNERLQVMQSTLERGTRVCKEFPELWYYLAVVSEKLGQDKDAQYAREKLERFKEDGRWDPKLEFDPFTMPPVPQRAPAASPPMLATALASSPVGKKWALVVGIDKFQDKRAPQLQYAAKDSRDFVNFLEDPHGGRFEPSHVIHLENEEATLKGIKEGLGKLRVEAKPDDLIVLYLSGHGSPRDVDPNGVSYIITHDTDLQDAATLYATSLQMIDLVQEINRELKARQVVLILDTCYSGDALTNPNNTAEYSGSKGFLPIKATESDQHVVGNENPPADAPASSSFSAAFDNLKVGYGRAVITASRANEQSWESPKLQNGYFTHYLLQVLEEGHGEESLDRVFAQVRTRVSSQVKTDHNASQNPSFEFSEHADSIVLGVPEAN